MNSKHSHVNVISCRIFNHEFYLVRITGGSPSENMSSCERWVMQI